MYSRLKFFFSLKGDRPLNKHWCHDFLNKHGCHDFHFLNSRLNMLIFLTILTYFSMIKNWLIFFPNSFFSAVHDSVDDTILLWATQLEKLAPSPKPILFFCLLPNLISFQTLQSLFLPSSSLFPLSSPQLKPLLSLLQYCKSDQVLSLFLTYHPSHPFSMCCQV